MTNLNLLAADGEPSWPEAFTIVGSVALILAFYAFVAWVGSQRD